MKKKGFNFLVITLFLLGTFIVYAEEQYLLKVNTEGIGQIAIVKEGEILEFSEEYPMQTAGESAEEGTKFTIGAKASDGYRFLKWTRNGEDYSEQQVITVELTEEMEFVAVFELSDDDDYTIIEEDVREPKSNSIFNIPLILICGAITIAILAIIIIISILNKGKKKKIS